MKIAIFFLYFVCLLEGFWSRRYTYNLLKYSHVNVITTTAEKLSPNCNKNGVFQQCSESLNINDILEQSDQERHGELLRMAFDENSKEVNLDINFNRKYLVKSLLLTFKEAHNISALVIEMYSNKKIVKKVSYAVSSLLCEYLFPFDSSSCNFRTSISTGIILHVQNSVIADKIILKFFPPIMINQSEKNVYSISQLFIGGRCSCTSGYHSQCIIAREDNNFRNDGTREILICAADRAYLFYGYYIYRRKRRDLDSCICHRNGTLHGLCKPFVGLDYQCPCKPNFSGSFCDKCSEGYHGFPHCTGCNCNFIGAVSSYCNTTTGQCACDEKYVGIRCDSCASGRYNFPYCYKCTCPTNRTDSSICDPLTGKCSCLERYTGDKCSSCEKWLENFPICHRPGCTCSVEGAVDGTCDDQKACYCKKNYAGKKCNYCALGYGNYPKCTACNCNLLGAYDNNCDFTSGQCFCRPYFTGPSCDQCANSSLAFPNCNNIGQCFCNENGTRYDAKRPGACIHRESCFCKGHVMGIDCSECKPGYYNMSMNNTYGCDDCACSKSGTFGNLAYCDQQNGQCVCKPSIIGRTCNQCRTGYYQMDRWNVFGCTACNCNTGGSLYQNCSENGRCQCKDNFEGKLCDKLKDGPYYVPDFYHNKIEIEIGLSNGEPVRYQFSNEEFSNFTGSGYVTFGTQQSDVKLTLKVPKTRKYKILLRNLLKEPTKTTLLVYLRSKTKEMSYAGVIDFNTETQNDFEMNATTPKYDLLQNTEGNKEFVLTKGLWEMNLSSISGFLLVDHIVIIPEEYYTANRLQHDDAMPCVVDQSKGSMCKMYKYISLDKFQIIQAESGTNSKGFGKEEITNTLLFKNLDILEQLPVLNDMAELSRNQIALTLEINAIDSADYYVVVTYFNPDQRTYRLDMYENLTGKRGFIEALPCLYSFLCRVVVLEHGGTPLALRLEVNKTSSLTFIGNIRGSLALDYIVLMPSSNWSADYILPHELCYMRDKKCLQNVAFETPEDSIVVKPSKSNPANPLTKSVYAVSETTVFFEASLMKLSKYVLVYQYYQPNFPSFTMEVKILQGLLASFGNVIVKRCSANFGCRGVFINGVLQGNVTVRFEIPEGKELWVDSMFLVPSETYYEDLLLPKRQELTTKFQRSCLGENSLPLIKPPGGFCEEALITLTSEFTNKTFRCDCSQRGSYSLDCDKIGGQCKCKPGVVGQNCDRCPTGYYGFPYCKACNCFLAGSKSADCDRYGQCQCKDKYHGRICDRCVKGHWGFPDCKECNCDRRGSFSLTCRSHDGQCSCLRNYDGRQCDKCQVGHFDFPYCRNCNCNSAGIIITPDSPTGCYKHDPNRCDCKSNAEGPDCGVCKKHFYALSIRNPFGCNACNCSTFGTIPGSGPCNEITGQCFCQPNVVGLNCDVCKDGYYIVKTDRVFTCQPCLCSVGGSVNGVCDKQTGQCKCKARVTGLRCDRIETGEYYLPPIGQFVFSSQDIVPSATIEHLDNFDGAHVNESFASKQMVLKILPSDYSSDVDGVIVDGTAGTNFFNPESSSETSVRAPFTRSYYVVLFYALTATRRAKVDLMFTREASDPSLNEHIHLKHRLRAKKTFEPTVDILRKNQVFLLLNLTEGSWKFQLIFRQSILFNQITIVPVEHFEQDKITQSIHNPCTIKDTERFCSLYTYYDLNRVNALTLEMEEFGGDNFTYFDAMKYKGTNISGALKVEKEFYFTSVIENIEEYYIIIQYLNTNQNSVKLAINVRLGFIVERGFVELFSCSYAFGCRQVVVLSNGRKALYRGGEGARYFEIKTLAGDDVFIDFVALVPSSTWISNLLTPAFYCMRRMSRYIDASFPVTRGMFSLEAESASGLSVFNNAPPDGQPSTVAVLLSRFQRNLRWISPLRLGGYYIIVHYYQPVTDNFYAKIIIATYQVANAGKISFKYCPSKYGCRSVITYLDEDLPHRFPLQGNFLRATFTMLPHNQVWVDRLEFITPSEYESNPNILDISPQDLSKRYLRKCVGRKDKYIETFNRDFCRTSAFELTLGLNKYPQKCKCDPQGTLSLIKCNPYDGQCACSAGFTGRDCSKCIVGTFPICKPKERLHG